MIDMRYMVCFVFLICSLNSGYAQSLKLASDLTDDIKTLKTNNAVITKNNEHYELKQALNDLQFLQSLAKSDLSHFKFKHIADSHTSFSKWENGTGKIKAIYQLTIAIPVDTVVRQMNASAKQTADSIRVKGIFTYTYYLVKLFGRPSKIVYITQKGQGLLHYIIGRKSVSISYEAILIGPDEPYLAFHAAVEKWIPH